MEGITDADYTRAKKVCKDFELIKLGEYHDLYLSSDTLLLADVCQKSVPKNLPFRSCKISFRSWNELI